MLYVIQICKQNENAGKNIHIHTHQQSMKLIIRMGKMHSEVQFLYINFDVIFGNCNWSNILLIFINIILSKI